MRHYLSLFFTALFLGMTQMVLASTSHDDDNERAPGVGTVARSHSGGSLGILPLLSGTTVRSFNLHSLIFSRELGLFDPHRIRYMKAMEDLAQHTGNPSLFQQDHAQSYAYMPLSELELLVDQKRLGGALDPQTHAGRGYFAFQAQLKNTSGRAEYARRGLLLCPTFRRATHLERLALTYACLTVVPDGLLTLTRLESLYLSQNQLTSMPDLSTLTKLKWLYLSDNQLREVPAGLSTLTNLQSLGLSQNQLREVPAGLSTLTNLQSLNLESNSLTFTPDLSALTNLKMLELANNQLREWPDGLSTLTNLQMLSLGGNQLTSIPDLSTLLSLRALHLDAALCQDQKLLNTLQNIRRSRQSRDRLWLYAYAKDAQGKLTQVNAIFF